MSPALLTLPLWLEKATPSAPRLTVSRTATAPMASAAIVAATGALLASSPTR